jgi:hypothetical protein
MIACWSDPWVAIIQISNCFEVRKWIEVGEIALSNMLADGEVEDMARWYNI